MYGYLGSLFLIVSFAIAAKFAHAQVELSIDSELIADLNSDQFEVRERASRKLLRCGPEVIERLKLLPERDLTKEAQNRIDSVVGDLEKLRLAGLAQAFLIDNNDKNSHGLPGWHAFRQFVDSTRISKQLFLSALQSQPEIMGLIDEVHTLRATTQNPLSALGKLHELTAFKSSYLLDQSRSEGIVSTGDTVAIMLAVAVSDDPASYEVSQYIRSCVELRFSGDLSRQGVRNYLLTLLSLWIPKSPESMAPEVLTIARQLNQPAVLPIARTHLSKSFDPFTREQAIICICKFGEPRDAEALLQYAHDTTIIDKVIDSEGDESALVESRAAPPGIVVPASAIFPQKLIRINDLAVAAAMRLLRDDPAKVFPNYKAEQFLTSWRSSVLLPEAEQQNRNEAIAGWLDVHGEVSTKTDKLRPIPDPISVPER